MDTFLPLSKKLVTAAEDCVRPAEGPVSRAAHGYEPTCEAAMQAFAKSWRRE
jgi:hypothetical protein